MRRSIRVKPASSRTKVGGTNLLADRGLTALVVAVQAPAVDGKANKAVLTALAKALGLKPRDLVIVSGHTARTKLVELPDEVAPRWQELLDDQGPSAEATV